MKIKTMIWVFGYLASLICAIPIGTNCSLGDEYCGSISDLEMLICDLPSYTCKGTYLNNNCNSSAYCAQDYYCNDLVGICDNCPSGCNVCNKKDYCSICLPGYFLQYGVCYSLPDNCMTGSSPTNCTACESEFFLSNGTCNPCRTNCITCTAANNCQACATGMFWDPIESACGPGITNCVSPVNDTACTHCNEGYYLYTDKFGTSSCVIGTEDCQCVYPLGTCQTCDVGYFLVKIVRSTCAVTNLDTNTCSKIALSNCNTSTDGVTCASCINGFFLTANCNPKVPNCDVPASAVACKTCSAGFYLKTTVCNQCYMTNIAGQITSSCATCTGPYRANCTSCLPNYYMLANASFGCLPCAAGCACLTPGACDNGCLPGYYVNGITCAQCSTGCSTCNDNTECTVCSTGYFLTNNQCVACASPCTYCTAANVCAICSNGYYVTNGQCTACPPTCAVCSSPTACTSCLPGYYITGGSCSQCNTGCICQAANTCPSCQNGYYLNNNVCSQCGTGCISCTSNTVCVTCSSGYSLNAAGTCVKCGVNCPVCVVNGTGKCDYCNAGYIIRNDYSGCDLFPVGCATVDYWPDQCSSCVAGYALATGLSVQQPCQPCDANCKVCPPSLPHNCTQCMDGYYVDESNICNYQCGSNCSQCLNDYWCNVCSPNYYLNQGTCTQIADPNCLASTDGQNCTQCKPGYVFVQQNFTCVQCSYTNQYVNTCAPPPLNSTGKPMAFAILTTLSCLPGSLFTQVCSSPMTGCDVLASPNICSVCSAEVY